MCPRKTGRSTSPTRSVGDERGFTNWPAIRPTFTTGSVAPYVSTADICSMIFSFSRMRTVESSLNDSAQSPAWSTKAFPATTPASASRSLRASPAKTSGGEAFSRSSARSACAASGHSGCCSAVSSRHEDGDHEDEDVTATRSV